MVAQGDPTKQNNPLQSLYDGVSAKFDIGTYDDFAAKMATPEDRKKFYDAVGNKGFDLGEYDQYESRLAGTSKKKDTPVSEVGSVENFMSAFGVPQKQDTKPSSKPTKDVIEASGTAAEMKLPLTQRYKGPVTPDEVQKENQNIQLKAAVEKQAVRPETVIVKYKSPTGTSDLIEAGAEASDAVGTELKSAALKNYIAYSGIDTYEKFATDPDYWDLLQKNGIEHLQDGGTPMMTRDFSRKPIGTGRLPCVQIA